MANFGREGRRWWRRCMLLFLLFYRLSAKDSQSHGAPSSIFQNQNPDKTLSGHTTVICPSLRLKLGNEGTRNAVGIRRSYIKRSNPGKPSLCCWPFVAEESGIGWPQIVTHRLRKVIATFWLGGSETSSTSRCIVSMRDSKPEEFPRIQATIRTGRDRHTSQKSYCLRWK